MFFPNPEKVNVSHIRSRVKKAVLENTIKVKNPDIC